VSPAPTVTVTAAITTPTASTNAVISSRILELESVIERGRQAFLEVGAALREISGRRLYREQGFKTFDEYCEKRWGWKRNKAYYYIQAAEVAENVHLSGQIPSLTQARELAVLPPDQQRQVAGHVDFSATTVRELKEEIQHVKNPEFEANKTPSFKPKSLRKVLTEKSYKAEIIRLTGAFARYHPVAAVHVEVRDSHIQVDIHGVN
jgi:enamine deaminase RidA (YjgF/YER057c/UK114 family)